MNHLSIHFPGVEKFFSAIDKIVPTARKRDPQTSHDAAAEAKDLANKHRHVIMLALKRGPAGKDRIAELTGLDGVQVCRRLTELERAGAIATTGNTVRSRAGRSEREWAVQS